MEASQTNNEIPNPSLNVNSISLSSAVWPTIDGPLGLSEEESLSYASKFYKFGFALLPWLWAVNCFYFWPVLFHRRSFPSIHHFYSLLVSCGSLIWFSLPHSLKLLGTVLGGKSISRAVIEPSMEAAGKKEAARKTVKVKKQQLEQVILQIWFRKRKTDVIRSAIGFTVFTAVLSSWALTFAIGGERLFGPVWDQLVMYNLADRLGLTSWS
ncbi:hypothetical protein FEM48_Zijuj08G0193700 [Ziziphus jujuba var. spinosa]|uniref:Gamma-secretase subunit PEN-2 n=1 Tax=Ziziphus jujuba var. spinosa TaxID=714518 RepID=A0A978V0X3_ZIZJJ|nr:hypothetical protein FEM48_Zijuj08G0193700 [Ziziphus jujuba var. spinosa]